MKAAALLVCKRECELNGFKFVLSCRSSSGERTLLALSGRLWVQNLLVQGWVLPYYIVIIYLINCSKGFLGVHLGTRVLTHGQVC